MALRDQPYIPLYVKDFTSDEKLRMCSPSAVGVYIFLMCILHREREYGKLQLRQSFVYTKGNTNAIQNPIQKTQSKEILAPSRYEQYIKYTQDDKNELFLSHNFEFEKGEFDEHKMQTTVPKGTKLQFRYINSNPERTAALDADLLVIVLKNGKALSHGW